jgi:hypothetical protein
MKYILPFLIIITAFFCRPAFIFAGDIAPPVPTVPQQMEVSAAPVPIEMMVEDAERLIQQMKNNSAPVQPQQAEPAVAVPSAYSSSSSIKLEIPEVVNKTPNFRFRDITARSGTDRAVRTMSERISAVEAYRQSVIKEKK